MSEKILKVSYSNSKSAFYEAGTSNPKLINKINDNLNEAERLLSGVPDTGSIGSILYDIYTKLNSEKKRYDQFAPELNKFYEKVKYVDSELAKQIHKLNYENCSDNIEILKSTVDIFYSLAEVADLSETESAKEKDILVKDLQKQIEKNKREGKPTSELENILSAIWETNFGDLTKAAFTIGDMSTTVLNQYINKEYPQLTDSEKVALQGKIERLSNGVSRHNKLFIKPGSKTTKELEGILNEIAEDKKAVQVSEDGAKYSKAISRINIGLTALQLGVQGYHDIVVDGQEWNDTAQDLIVTGSGIAVSGIAKAGTEYVFTNLGASAGLIGIACCAVILGGTYIYDKHLKQPIHDKLDETEDWWEELCW